MGKKWEKFGFWENLGLDFEKIWEFLGILRSGFGKIWGIWGKCRNLKLNLEILRQKVGKNQEKVWEKSEEILEIKANFGRKFFFRNLGLDFENFEEFLRILGVGKIWGEISGEKNRENCEN